MGRWVLHAAVGVDQPNRRRDVLVVQQLLNRTRQDDPEAEFLVEDGFFGPRTASRLREFQSKVVHLTTPDGIAEPAGPTLARLAPDTTRGHGERSSGMGRASSSHSPVVAPEDALARVLRRQAAAPKSEFKRSWINLSLPVATEVKATWRVPIAVTIAQGALESDWGRHAPGNVYFGVKGKAPDGGTIALGTHEVTGGVRHSERDGFRSYDTLASSADDYGRFLANNHRYAAAFLHCDDPDLFIHYVAINGYATDPDYERKIRSIMAANGLKDFDRGAHAVIYNDAVSIGQYA